jgi:hypothetical protein
MLGGHAPAKVRSSRLSCRSGSAVEERTSVTNPNVTPSPPWLEADRTSAMTPQSPETDANVTLENVRLIDGVPTRNGLPVLDEAQSNTDHGVAGQPAERAPCW